MIKTILVDYAGVLTTTQDNSIFSKKYSDYYGLSAKKLMDIFYENWPQAATGKIKAETFWSQIADKLNTDVSLLRSQVLASYPLNQQLISFLEKKAKKYKLVMTSNQIEDWIDWVFDQEPKLKKIFHLTSNSYQLGIRKPNLKFFQAALRLAESSAEETLFIDDNLSNVQAAEKLGIVSVRYKDFLSFKQKFNQCLKIC